MVAQDSALDGFRVHAIDRNNWHAGYTEPERREAARVLESGSLILLPHLAFSIEDTELPLMEAGAVQPHSKNVVFDPASGRLRRVSLPAGPAENLRQMLERYANQSLALVRSLLPRYAGVMRIGRASFRPVEACGRTTSKRKDDTRLHVDAFPSTPNQGKRLLRVFTNVNMSGRDRLWRIGQPFEEVARRFLPTIPRPSKTRARLLQWLGITRGLRTDYDQIMLDLHDRMKADEAYQEVAGTAEIRFAPGSTWVVQSDVVSHAVLSGQFMMEQTFIVPVAGMFEPRRSPLRILERLSGRPLA